MTCAPCFLCLPQAALRRAQHVGCARAATDVARGNAAAVRFFLKQGFAEPVRGDAAGQPPPPLGGFGGVGRPGARAKKGRKASAGRGAGGKERGGGGATVELVVEDLQAWQPPAAAAAAVLEQRIGRGGAAGASPGRVVAAATVTGRNGLLMVAAVRTRLFALQLRPTFAARRTVVACVPRRVLTLPAAAARCKRVP